MEEFLTQQGEPGQAPPTGGLGNKGPSSQLSRKTMPSPAGNWLLPSWLRESLCCDMLRAIFLRIHKKRGGVLEN